MRSYIIGNDGIALCRKAPATVSEGEIVVASKEELHAAPLSGKRLLALWNALPGVDKRRKVGDREALIEQLWSAIEALPDPEPRGDPKRPSKQDVVIAMLRQPEGATVGSGANSHHEQTFLLCRAEFRPEAPRSRLQVQFDLERREVAV